MAGEYNRFAKNARAALSVLDRPAYVQEAQAQDLHPANVQELQRAIGDRRHQQPMQQQVLGDELKRIKALQMQQLQQAQQQMPQQLQKSLDPGGRTGEPWPSSEATMVRLMLQMQRRHGMAPYQRREDGSRKGRGFFGPISTPDGRDATELSYSDPGSGQRSLAPLLVPGMSRQQIDHLISGGAPTDEIYSIANRHAAGRSSPFANIREEGQTPLPPR